MKDRLTASCGFEGRIHHRMKSPSILSYAAFGKKLQVQPSENKSSRWGLSRRTSPFLIVTP